MNTDNLNVLMVKYLKAIEDKDMFSNLAYSISEDLCIDIKIYEYHKTLPNYTQEDLDLERKRIMRAIRDYNETQDNIRNLVREIDIMGSQINKLRTEPKRVRFLIPGTVEFSNLLTKYIRDGLNADN